MVSENLINNLSKKISHYLIDPSIQLDDVTEEDEPEPLNNHSPTKKRSRSKSRSKSRSPSREPGPSTGYRRSSRLRNKKVTANSKRRNASPTVSSGHESSSSQKRSPSAKNKRKRRKRSRSLSSEGSPSRSFARAARTGYTLIHKVNGNTIKFISNEPFPNNKLPKKACRYFTKSCIERILTKRDKQKRNVTVVLNKRTRT